MKKYFFILFLAISSVCSAQMIRSDMAVGMEISGFRVPDYDEHGVLRAQLYGEHAKVLANQDVEITNLKIEMYQDGKVAMTIFAPHCFFNTETHVAHSTGRVLVESDWMSVVGVGFTWSADDGYFKILKQSKVLVKQHASGNLKDIEL